MGFFNDHTFFFVAFGSAALIVTIYHCVLSVFCHPQQHFNEQPQPAAGLGQVDIHSIPIHKHTKTTGKSPNEECPVCLSEFEDGEELRTLPKCLHTFHVDCIDLWLHSHPNCPTCRTDAMPAVQETSTNNNSSSNAGATVNLVSINSISQDLEAQHRVV